MGYSPGHCRDLSRYCLLNAGGKDLPRCWHALRHNTHNSYSHLAWPSAVPHQQQLPSAMWLVASTYSATPAFNKQKRQPRPLLDRGRRFWFWMCCEENFHKVLIGVGKRSGRWCESSSRLQADFSQYHHRPPLFLIACLLPPTTRECTSDSWTYVAGRSRETKNRFSCAHKITACEPRETVLIDLRP